MIDSQVLDRVHIGMDLDEQAIAMFHLWHKYELKATEEEGFQKGVIPIDKQFREILYQGRGRHDGKLLRQ